METIQIELNKGIVDKATVYAQQRGLELSVIVEDYLERLARQVEISDEPVPDIILSLLGAGEDLEEEDLNGRKGHFYYLDEKYR